MQKRQRTIFRAGLGLIAVLLLAACASTAYIPVRYQLAPKSKALQGKQVFLTVTDSRSDTRIFDAEAQQAYEGFNGYFALSLAYGDEKGLVAGTYDLATLFQEALRYKLQNTGVEVLSQPHDATATMAVHLNEFLLSLSKNKWVAAVGYKVII